MIEIQIMSFLDATFIPAYLLGVGESLNLPLNHLRSRDRLCETDVL